MGTGSGGAIAATGMATAALGVSVTASNIANALTPDYTPSRVEQAELADGGVSGHVVKQGDPLAEVRADRALLAGSGVDLTQEIVTQLVSAQAFEANLKAAQTSFDLEGELIKALKP
jgi:flagellar hook protein FlgE